MSDRCIQLANAIVASIGANGGDASREWNPTIQLSDSSLVAPVFWVVPKDDNSEKIATSGTEGACSQQQDFTVYVIVQFRPPEPNTATAVDVAANLIYTVHEAMKQTFLTLADGTKAKWQKSLCTGHDFAQANRGMYRKEYETHWRVIS